MSKVFKAVGGLVGKLLPSAKVPKMETMVAPDRDSTAAKLASRNKIDRKKMAGREGTIYSGNSYSGANLAGTA